MNFKTFEFMQYFEHYDTDDKTVLASRISSLTQCKTYAIIVHDRDIKDDGTPKPPHFHAVVTLKNAMTGKSIAKALKCEEQYINKIKTSTGAALRYLVHANNPEKAQYDAEDVLANFDYSNKLDDLAPKKTRLDEIIERIGTGEIREYNLHNFVTIEEYTKHRRAIESAFKYKYDAIESGERNMECMFITGQAGSGKTTFAKMLCQNNKLSYYISDGGAHPLDGYRGQDAIILDDLRASDYKFSEFLKLTDNNTASRASSRFYNKSLAWCRVLIVTSTIPLSDWYKGLQEYDGESRLQMERRFTCRYNVEEQVIHCLQFDARTGGLWVGGDIENPAYALNQRTKKELTERVMKYTTGFKSYQKPFVPETYTKQEVIDARIIDSDDDLPF